MDGMLTISRSQSATHSSWPKLRDKTTQCNGMLNSPQGPLAALILACRPGLVSHLAGVINTSIEARYSNAAPNASLLLGLFELDVAPQPCLEPFFHVDPEHAGSHKELRCNLEDIECRFRRGIV